jgi:pyrroloquinoline quinone biosynthesis protein D
MAVTAQTMPSLRRGIRRQYDAARNDHVLLGPERVIVLDDIALAITELFDGARTVAAISATLAAKFEADVAVVQTDVIAFIEDLIGKGLAAP